MNRKSSPRQLALFLAESPTWESLPHDRQQALQELLSLLLEQAISQPTCRSVDDAQETGEEQSYV
jgi:hypothetical protein